jgi:hypothetical protein
VRGVVHPEVPGDRDSGVPRLRGQGVAGEAVRVRKAASEQRLQAGDAVQDVPGAVESGGSMKAAQSTAGLAPAFEGA